MLGSAAIAVVFELIQAYLAGRTPVSHPDEYGAFLFLGYLSVVTLIMVRHGVRVLRTRRDPHTLDTPLHRTMAWVAMLASVFIIGFALLFKPGSRIVLLALSPIGIGVGRGMLAYLNGPRPSPREWFYEHMGAMLGGGIAFHTAFAVFGMNRLWNLGLEGWMAVIPWILPAAIGIPATTIWTRHYRRKFGQPLRGAAS